jgi:hypothetical protein
VLGYFGAQVAMSKREGVLALFGERAGLAPRTLPPAALPRVIDTSVAIDGGCSTSCGPASCTARCSSRRPVLAELQGLADAGDDVRRPAAARARGARGAQARGRRRRRGARPGRAGVHEVDAKLVRICLDRGAALLTLDTNLAKAAALAGVRVLNLHALALAMRPPVAAGDDVPVLLLKAGKEAGQAVGYLDDGSMVVVEGGRPGSARRSRSASPACSPPPTAGWSSAGPPTRTPRRAPPAARPCRRPVAVVGARRGPRPPAPHRARDGRGARPGRGLGVRLGPGRPQGAARAGRRAAARARRARACGRAVVGPVVVAAARRRARAGPAGAVRRRRRRGRARAAGQRPAGARRAGPAATWCSCTTPPAA